MQTWLDSFVAELARSIVGDGGNRVLALPDNTHPEMALLKKQVARLKRDDRAGHGGVLDAAQWAVQVFWALNEGRPESAPSEIILPGTAVGAVKCLFDGTLPWIYRMPDAFAPTETKGIPAGRAVISLSGHGFGFPDAHPCRDFPVAIRLERGLVADLVGARAPRSEEIEHELQTNTFYIDLPHRSVAMGRLEVRALLTYAALDQLIAVAVLTDPGTNRTRVALSWSLLGEDWSAFPGVEPRGLEAAIADLGLDRAEAQRELGNLIRLVVAYHLTLGSGERAEVPRIDPLALAGDRNWRAKQKKFTLFRVLDVRRASDRFGRADVPTVGTWALGHLVKVRGYFKMQHYGPRAAQRKLIYVAPYEKGPEGEPARADLKKIGRPSR